MPTKDILNAIIPPIITNPSNIITVTIFPVSAINPEATKYPIYPPPLPRIACSLKLSKLIGICNNPKIEIKTTIIPTIFTT